MNVDGTAEQKKTYYAVFIGNRYGNAEICIRTVTV